MSGQRYIEQPPEGAAGWREVWQKDLVFRPAPKRFEWLRRFVRRVVRLVDDDFERQRDFNLAVLDLLRDGRAHADAVKRDLHADFRNDIEGLHASLSSALSAEGKRLHELLLVGTRRNDALAAALDQKIETVSARLRDAVNPVVPPSPADVTYRRLEDALRGSEVQVRADVAHYVALASGAQPALDVGCGRGEFLDECRAAGVAARGIDSNERSVADLRQRGLQADVGTIPECFAAVESGSVGSILAMHVVEHLPVDALFALFREAARVLRRGGLLMIETPNAESMLVSASEFWRDPTHLAPRHPAALGTLGREHGFEIDEIRAVHDLPEGTRLSILESDPPALRRVVEAINEKLFAPQDLRLVLRKA